MDIEKRIFLVRGMRVMLDSDLARLYGVPTKYLNQQVRRNRARFPKDFMFELDQQEAAAIDSLRLQFATLNAGRGRHRKYPSLVFTEQGVAMLSSVRLRDLRRAINLLEEKSQGQFKEVFAAIRKLMSPDIPARPLIGFKP